MSAMTAKQAIELCEEIDISKRTAAGIDERHLDHHLGLYKTEFLRQGEPCFHLGIKCVECSEIYNRNVRAYEKWLKQ